MPTLHVVMPTYNERDTLVSCVERVMAVEIPLEWTIALWIVDDHSKDESWTIAQDLTARLENEGRRVTLTRHEENRGKGAALQTGFDLVLGADAADDDVVIIQDADLEYDPGDYPLLLVPLIGGRADVVIGTRWSDLYERRSIKRRMHVKGNQALTALSNLMTGYRLSDMECCYKLMSVATLRDVRPHLTEQRFGVEPQMVAVFARHGLRVAEVPIRYDPRGLAAGKKIGWKDGVRALVVIARERFLRGRGVGVPAS